MHRIASSRAQRGIALLGLLAVIVMVFAYVITSRLNAASQFVAIDREHNAKVMARAKRALIGYMAQQASQPNELNPGRLPCPEAVNAIGTTSEGIAAPMVVPSTPACATLGRLPWRTLGLEKLVDASSEPLWYAVSPDWRLQSSSTLLKINPDRDLLTAPPAVKLAINGAVPVAPNPEVIAVIIAPGPAMNVQATPNCTARAQSRGTPAPTMNPLDYVECFNTATPRFSTAGPATSFNDQVLTVTTADVMPALEAAIQERMQREIAPAVRSAAFELKPYVPPSPREWGADAILSTSPPPLYPYAAPFADPAASNYLGIAGTSRGLLPFAPVAASVQFSSVTNASQTTANGKVANILCAWETATVYTCTGDYEEKDASAAIGVEMTALFTNVAMGLRARNTAALTAEARDDVAGAVWSTSNVATTKTMVLNDVVNTGKPQGSVTATLSVILPNHQAMGWGKWAEFRLRMDRAAIADHPLHSSTGRALPFSGGFSDIKNGNTVTGAVSGASGAVQVLVNSGKWSTGDAAGVLYFTSVSGSFQSGEALRVGGTTRATSAGTDFDIGWFARNEWYRNVYYAAAPKNIPDTLPTVSDCDSSNCLSFNDGSVHNARVLLVIGGRKVGTQTRPNAVLANYLEGQNISGTPFYEQHRMRAGKVFSGNSPWNDRLVVVDWISPAPTFPIAYLP